MTIQWGSYSGGLRVGIQVENVTTPTNGSSSCTVTVSFWVGTSSSQTFQDNQTMNMSQTGGTSISDNAVNYFNDLNQSQTMKVGPNQTVVRNYTDYGVAHSVNITGAATGLFNGGTPSKTISVTIPARPWANPAPTLNASSSRVSDSQASITWTNQDTTSAKYSNIKMYRKTDGGSFALIATLGVVTSYSDNGISANHKYRHRPNVLGSNGAEITGDESNDIWTTPGAPSSCAATKLASGNIQVTWANNVNYSEYTTRIEHSEDGGAFSELTSVANGVTSYEHVSPNTGVTHTYRVRARSTNNSLNSAYSANSNTVTLLSTAGAPTGLSPSGVYHDATEAIVFTWTHNPTDGTPQSKFQLQWSINGGTDWTTVGPTTSSVSSYTLPASTTTNPQTITWHVATAGENGTIGAYSSNSVFNTQDRPTSTISSPGSSYTNSKLTVSWTYFQAQSAAQSSWHAFLWEKGLQADYSDAILIGEATGSGTTPSYLFPNATLLDGETYGVRVYVTSATGLSSIDSGTPRQEFTVDYLPPADATLSLSYDADYGRMTIIITGTGSTVGVTEDISTVDLQRQIDGGEWITWIVGVVLDNDHLANLVDVKPTVNGENRYRAIIRSAVPSSKISPEVAETTAEKRWGFLSSFQGNFADVLRMRARLVGRSTTGRSKSVYVFAGRENPVELSGEDTSKVYDVAVTLYGTSSTPEELEAVGETEGIVLWRDYRGRRMFASISPVSANFNTDSVLFPVTFSLTRVDYNENVE